MRNRALIISLLFVQLIVGCTGSSYVSEILSRAEGLMSEHPDSAYTLLNEIDQNMFDSSAQRARFARLITKAQYKNYKTAESDSLIQTAISYYEKHNMKTELAESYMLRGNIEIEKKQNHKAMHTLQIAAELGEEIGEDFLLGQIYSNLYDLCRTEYNADQVIFAEKALEYYRKNGDEYYIIDAMNNLGMAYFRVEEFEKSESILEEVYERAKEMSDTFSMKKALPTLARMKIRKKDFASSDSILNLLQKDFGYKLRPIDVWALAESQLKEGNKTSAIAMMDSVSKREKTTGETLIFNFSASDFYSRVGDYNQAWALLWEYEILDDSIDNARFKETIMSAQRDYLEQKLEIQKIEEDRNRITWTGCVILILLIMAFVIYYYRRQSEVHSLEMEKLMLQITDMEQSVSGKESVIDELKRQVQSVMSDSEKMRTLVNEVYAQKYQQLNNLCVSYFSGQSSIFTRNAIYKEVQSIIESFGKDHEDLKELEYIVNSTKEDILVKLREELPALKESEYFFFCYTFAGFSSRAISLLLHENIDTIYQHRSRWKKKIELQNPLHKDLFLKNL